MSSYMKMTQGEEESVAQYLARAKTYLERINHTLKLFNMNGGGLNHMLLVQGVQNSYIRQRVVKEAKNWGTMEGPPTVSSNMLELQKGLKPTTN